MSAKISFNGIVVIQQIRAIQTKDKTRILMHTMTGTSEDGISIDFTISHDQFASLQGFDGQYAKVQGYVGQNSWKKESEFRVDQVQPMTKQQYIKLQLAELDAEEKNSKPANKSA